jgi:hypothetical protein
MHAHFVAESTGYAGRYPVTLVRWRCRNAGKRFRGRVELVNEGQGSLPSGCSIIRTLEMRPIRQHSSMFSSVSGAKAKISDHYREGMQRYKLIYMAIKRVASALLKIAVESDEKRSWPAVSYKSREWCELRKRLPRGSTSIGATFSIMLAARCGHVYPIIQLSQTLSMVQRGSCEHFEWRLP